MYIFMYIFVLLYKNYNYILIYNMSYNIEIDHREHHLIELFNTKNNDYYIIKNLDIGDIIIKDSNNNIIYIIERKTISDLCSSIIDNRYKEQKQRLLSNFNTDNIIYIIEGNDKVYNTRITYKTIMSTIINMNLRDKISVIRTYNLEETYINIMLILDKLENKKLIINKSEEINNLIKTSKKQNLDNNLYYLTILSQIPGMSINTAKLVQQIAPSILELYDIYKNNNTDIIKNILINKKKLGAKLTYKIFNYLFNVDIL